MTRPGRPNPRPLLAPAYGSLTTTDIAQHLHISRDDAAWALRTGQIPGGWKTTSEHGHWRIDRAAYAAWFRSWAEWTPEQTRVATAALESARSNQYAVTR